MRRKPGYSKSSGRHIKSGSLDAQRILLPLHDFGLLDTLHIIDYARTIGSCSGQYIKDRLTDLFHEPHSEHLGVVLGRWSLERDETNVRFPAFHSLSANGYKVLADVEMTPISPPVVMFDKRPGLTMKHKIMEARIMYVLIKGARADGVKPLPWHQVLQHPLCPEQTRNMGARAFALPMGGGKKKKIDQFMSFVYPNGKVRHCIIEVDTGTEGISKVVRHIEDYIELLSKPLYKQQLGIKHAGLYFVFHSERRMSEAMEKIARRFPRGHEDIYFNYYEGAQLVTKMLPPTTHLWTSDWERIEHTSFNFARLAREAVV